MIKGVIENYERPAPRVFIAESASHYIGDVFPEPVCFDMECFVLTRKEHVSPGTPRSGWARTHAAAAREAELQLAINRLMLAHGVTFKVAPEE